MSSSKNISKEDETFEPGAARFGNFINYYSFNSTAKRLHAIPSDLLYNLILKDKPLVCLDIGCNSGDLTLALYSHLVSDNSKLPEVFMLGIDLDETLISRSIESSKYTDHVTFKQIDIMDKDAVKQLELYLQEYNRTKFDLITCFSTTMWIHLNHGDEGLNTFLRTISNLTKYFLVEPQEWKCYRSVARRMRRLNREDILIQQLNVKNISEHLEKYLTSECSMNLKTCYGETSWDRKLYLYESSVSNFLIDEIR